MADQQLEILIKAVDDASDTLKRIEGNMSTMSKNVQKQTEKTSDAFDKQMGSMIVLGQAASSVDHIFSSYQNLQLRLENASERVANAQDRLRKAEYNLKKVQNDTSKSAEDLAEAQSDVESASRALTISQNNLERANNMVIGTYINMGVSVLSLIKMMPVLISSTWSLVAAGAALALTPLGILVTTFAALGFAIHGAVSEMEKADKLLQENVTSSYNNYQKEYIKYQDMQNSRLKIFNERLKEQYDLLMGIISGPLEGENQAKLEIAEQDRKLTGLQLDLAKAMTDSDKERIQTLIDEEQRKMDILQLQYQYNFDTYKAIEIAKGDVSLEQNKRTQGIYATTFAEIQKAQIIFRDASIQIARQMADEEVAQANRVKVAWQEAYQAYIKAEDAKQARQAAINSRYAITPGGPGGTSTNLAPTYKFNDFISRPGQPVASFSPSDTIIGTKGGMGIVIEITGNQIYGTDPSDIADGIMQQLRRKISV